MILRNLPETKEAWEELKQDFLKMPDTEDTPETWTFVLSQLQNTKMPELLFELTDVWKHYKRWKIAQVLQDVKTVYIAELEAKLQSKLKALQEEAKDGELSSHAEHVPSGSFYSEGELPPLPITQEGVVSGAEERRF